MEKAQPVCSRRFSWRLRVPPRSPRFRNREFARTIRGVHALTNARIVAAPGKTIEKGTVLIRDGLIVEVGPDVKVPPEARVWDLAGKTIYPGFIDAYSRLDLPETLQPEPVRVDVDPDDPNAKPKEIPREMPRERARGIRASLRNDGRPIISISTRKARGSCAISGSPAL